MEKDTKAGDAATQDDFYRMIQTPQFFCVLPTTAQTNSGIVVSHSQSISASLPSNVEVSEFSLGLNENNLIQTPNLKILLD